MFRKYITDTFLASRMSLNRKTEFHKFQKRTINMLLQEYQAQAMLTKYSVPIPRVNI